MNATLTSERSARPCRLTAGPFFKDWSAHEMRRCVAAVNLIGKRAPEFSLFQIKRDADIRKNVYASVVSSVRGSVVPAKFIGKERAESTAFLRDVDICNGFFVNAVLAGGTACSKGFLNA